MSSAGLIESKYAEICPISNSPFSTSPSNMPFFAFPFPNISFNLEKNGEIVQKGNSANMIFHFDTIISYLSKFYSLKVGDLIYTGTPEGVGKVLPGDTLKGLIDDKEILKVVVK